VAPSRIIKTSAPHVAHRSQVEDSRFALNFRDNVQYIYETNWCYILPQLVTKFTDIIPLSDTVYVLVLCNEMHIYVCYQKVTFFPASVSPESLNLM